MKDKNLKIIYTLNDKFVPQVAAGICSVCENNKEMDSIDFYLINTDITEKNKKALTKFTEGYNRNVRFIKLGNIEDYIDFEFDTTGWNSIVLARLLIDKLLPADVEKALYLDGDTIVRGSLLELWNTNLSKYVLAASIEPTINKKRKADLGLADSSYCNAGVLLINVEKWRKEKAEKTILDYYKAHEGKLFANDQDAINGSLNKKILRVLPKYNFYNIFYQYPYWFLKSLMKPTKYFDKKDFKECKKNPVIIHYLGEERPWRRGNHHKYRKDYEKYLNMTPWKGENYEDGWKLYFVCWYIFNFCMKPFPHLRYKIIDTLIPVFMNHRAKNNTNRK